MKSLALFELTEQYRAAAEAMADLELPESAIADTLEGMRGEIEVKATNVAMMVKNMEATADSIRIAITAMEGRAIILEQRAERIREYLKQNMQATGINKISCPFFQLSLRNNPPKVVIAHEASIPAKYYIPQAPKLSKANIAADLKAGKDVSGAYLEQSQRVDIK